MASFSEDREEGRGERVPASKHTLPPSLFPVSAIILAGGRSTRMGRDKALLAHPEERETTFVAHLVRQLSTLCREVILVARDAEQATEYAAYISVRIVTDISPDKGPLMGIYSGLRAIQQPHALVIAV